MKKSVLSKVILKEIKSLLNEQQASGTTCYMCPQLNQAGAAGVAQVFTGGSLANVEIGPNSSLCTNPTMGFFGSSDSWACGTDCSSVANSSGVNPGWSNDAAMSCPSGSGGPGNPSGGGMCVVNNAAENAVLMTNNNPQLGHLGINQNFTDNMANKPNAFYQARQSALQNKLMTLRTDYPSQGGFLGYCQGENPMWQAKLVNKLAFIQSCMQIGC